jgi:hypothetical protein
MRKDILMPKVSDVYVAIVKDFNGEEGDEWNAYLVNNKKDPIENAFVSSKGYLTDVKGKETKSSILRHYYKVVPAKTAQKIEIVVEEVLKLNNEYFVSFYHNGQLLDKRFVFLSETIHEKNASNVPVIQKKGVWIK